MAHPLSRTGIRLGLAAVAVFAVAAIGLGALMRVEPEAAGPLGRTLSIAVVAPVEPEVIPGETMEVGALNDGFDRAVLERAAEPVTDETYLPPDAYVGETWVPPEVPQMPRPTPVMPVRVSEKPPAPVHARPDDRLEVEPRRTDPLADGSRAYGFDRPRPDYAGERRLRWERLRERPQGATSPPEEKTTGPTPYYPQ